MVFKKPVTVFVNAGVFEKVQIVHESGSCRRTIVPAEKSAYTVAVVGHILRMLKSGCKMMVLEGAEFSDFLAVEHVIYTFPVCNCLYIVFIVHIEPGTGYFCHPITFRVFIAPSGLTGRAFTL